LTNLPLHQEEVSLQLDYLSIPLIFILVAALSLYIDDGASLADDFAIDGFLLYDMALQLFLQRI